MSKLLQTGVILPFRTAGLAYWSVAKRGITHVKNMRDTAEKLNMTEKQYPANTRNRMDKGSLGVDNTNPNERKMDKGGFDQNAGREKMDQPSHQPPSDVVDRGREMWEARSPENLDDGMGIPSGKTETPVGMAVDPDARKKQNWSPQP